MEQLINKFKTGEELDYSEKYDLLDYICEIDKPTLKLLRYSWNLTKQYGMDTEKGIRFLIDEIFIAGYSTIYDAI